MSATDRLVTDLKRIVRNSEELLHTTKDAVGDKAKEVRERLSDALGTARRTCHDLEDKTIEGAKAMKPFATLLLGLMVIIAASASRRGGSLLMAAETSAPPAPIGVYDSRVIAYAHFWSAAYQRKLDGLTKAAKAAKAAEQTERFNELESALKHEQETNHLQVFSTAPVDDVLAEMKDRLPAIQKEAGVAKLVSRWDESALKEYQRARQVDVTDLLLREFKLDEKKMKVAQDIRKKKPLPLDQAQKLMRQGKL